MAKDEKNLLVALDIGTSNIKVMVAKINDNGHFDIVGLAYSNSKGVKKGVVVNIDANVQSIRQAIKEAELMANCSISSVFVGIAGSHIRSFNSSGMVAVKNKEVCQADMLRVIETAKAINITADQQILHVLPQEFIVDDQKDVRDPVGMSGLRLEAKINIVTGAISAAENIVKCVKRCDLEVNDLVVHPLAASSSVLSDDERELGVVLIDIGAGTTDIIVFSGGGVRYVEVIPIGGEHITNDIAMALRVSISEAEYIKKKFGVAKQSLADAEEWFDVPCVHDRGERKFSSQILSSVIEPRVEELYFLIQKAIQQSGYAELLSAGIVLTGGAALMKNMVELGEDIFLKPVRVGVPNYGGAMADVVCDPKFSVNVGLLQEAYLEHVRMQDIAVKTSMFKKIFCRIKEWFIGTF